MTLVLILNEENNYIYNVMNVYFIVSMVPQAFVQMLITKDYAITSDVLTWTPSGLVQSTQYKNSEEYFEEIKLG